MLPTLTRAGALLRALAVSMIPTRGRVRVVLWALTALLVLLPCAGCGGGAPAPEKAMCGAVIDITGFRQYPEAEQFVDQRLRNFLKGCDWLGYAAITGSSEGSPCHSAPVPLFVLPEENPNDNAVIEKTVRTAHLAEAITRTKNLLGCERDDARGSDVLGGLRAIGAQLDGSPAPDGERRIVVFSDMMSNIGALDLSECDYTDQKARAAKVEELKQKDLLPRLEGATVVIYGFNLLSERRPDCVPPLKLLWRAIFSAAGVPDDSVNIQQ
ncbi:hypothetical protein [Sphaerisporangium aureirubrum]|uniref:VWA domain-containing protein n=1 Tax=Sphaerisporangium aureirubrum TaxID=1544736 RepID=A0ABW1NTU8_9ACTN